MLTQDVTVKDFDGNEQTRTLHFHLGEDEILEYAYIVPQLEALAEALGKVQEGGLPSDTLRTEMTDVIKLFIRISYGERDPDDATKFLQDDPIGEGPIWRNFQQSLYYKKFLMMLLNDADVATSFMTRVMPDDLMAQVRDDQVAGLVNETAVVRSVEDTELPPKKKHYRDYTRAELVAMPGEQFDELVGTDSRAWDMDVMSIAMQRKGRHEQGGSPSSEG